MKHISLKVFATTCLLVLGGCSSGGGSNRLVVDIKDGVMTGSYDPRDLSSKDAQWMVGMNCADDKKLSYSETPKPNGKVGFTAYCK